MSGLAQLLFSLLTGSTLLTVAIEGVLGLAGAHGRIPYQDPAFRLAVSICLVLVLNVRFTYTLLFATQPKPRFSVVLAISSNVLAVGAYSYLLRYNIPFRWTGFSTTCYSVYGIGAVLSLGVAIKALTTYLHQSQTH
jgi:hypothetical protein